MNSKIVPVIMCGGAGTRLWQAPRERMPKQFVSLLGEGTLFPNTVLRVDDTDLLLARDFGLQRPCRKQSLAATMQLLLAGQPDATSGTN